MHICFIDLKMAQAFVRKIFSERRTESTIQVPAEQSSLNVEETKDLISQKAKEFIEKQKDAIDSSEKTYKLATFLNQALAEHITDHKIIINVSIAEQFGQGCKVVGKCLWNSNCDRVISVDVSNEKEICLISAFFSKIPNDDSSDEETDDLTE